GYQAGNVNTGTGNSFFGTYASLKNTSANYNTAIGTAALYSNATSSGNTAVGDSALYTQNAGSFNTGNVAIGNSALYTTSPTGLSSNGNNNTGVGEWAMRHNTTGRFNTAVGNTALYSSTTGIGNAAYGANALGANTTASGNSANGDYSLSNSTTGSFNTAMGDSSLLTNTTGTFNSALGYQANVAANNLTNATAIGNGSSVGSSNTIQLGNTSVVAVASSGNPIIYNPTLVAINSTATASASAIVSGYITSTSAALTTITLPTVANLTSQIEGSGTTVARGTTLCFTVDNTAGASVVTIATNTGTSVIGPQVIMGETTLTVQNGSLGIFKIVYITTTTAKIIRIS